MKLTLEHAIILILVVALIYYVYNHHDLLNDIVRIPDRDHPELKAVKDKHNAFTAVTGYLNNFAQWRRNAGDQILVPAAGLA